MLSGSIEYTLPPNLWYTFDGRPVYKYRSLVKKSTAVKLKASDYVGLPNNSAADCSIFLKFYREFEHMTLERPQKVTVTARRNSSKNLPNCE